MKLLGRPGGGSGVIRLGILGALGEGGGGAGTPWAGGASIEREGTGGTLATGVGGALADPAGLSLGIPPANSPPSCGGPPPDIEEDTTTRPPLPLPGIAGVPPNAPHSLFAPSIIGALWSLATAFLSAVPAWIRESNALLMFCVPARPNISVVSKVALSYLQVEHHWQIQSAGQA